MIDKYVVSKSDHAERSAEFAEKYLTSVQMSVLF